VLELNSKDKVSKAKKKTLKDSAGGESTPEEATPLPTPTPIPLQRYPATEVLDLTSRLSVSLFDQDAGSGGYYRGVRSLTERLACEPSLTPAEKDYYTIWISYLMASWENREGGNVSAEGLKAASEGDVDQVFEGE
jgi:hypothetical protein